MPPHRIAHLDMDAFFASVELLRYPELKGRPVVVGGRRADAPVLLPDGTRRFARLRDYVDLTDLPEGSAVLAQRLKAAVHAATGLTCSIGITPNKLLSKIASDLDKPNGTTILGMAEVPTRIWPLPVRKVNGIGPKANAKLADLGITTVGELAAAAPAVLQEHFGLACEMWLQRAARGIDDSPVRTSSEPKSVSRETTFERDLHVRRDRAELSAVFTALCRQVGADLRRKGYAARTIGIKLRFADFTKVTRDLTLPLPTTDGAAIRRAAGECLRRIDLTRRLRLLGVRASHLARIAEQDDAAEQRELPL